MPAMHYDTIWQQTHVRQPTLWPTWPILFPYVKNGKARLEIGAGAMPKFPIENTYFLDTSSSAIEKLKATGGEGSVGDAQEPLSFQDKSFDLVGAFEVLEHLRHPEKTIQEVSRVLRDNGRFIFSTPIHQQYWSSWDNFAGHVQRFEPRKLDRLLSECGFRVECCFVFRCARKWEIPLLKYVHSALCAVVSRFPQLHSQWDISFYPYLWMLKKITRPRKYFSLKEVPSNGLSLLVVCRKA